MTRRGTTVVAAFVLAVTLSGCGETDEVLLADGTQRPFASWSGKWLAINYWAEWCAPCRKEIPELNRLHVDGAELGLAVLGVNYDGLTGEKLSTLAGEMGIEFPVLVEDPRLRWGAEPPMVLPTTLIVNPEGQLHDTLVGPQHYEDILRATGLEAPEQAAEPKAAP